MLLHDGALVKTINFGKFNYIGDPCNTVRIFNELQVDELVFLDILATKSGCGPDFNLLKDIAEECFMPLSYGGGIVNIEQVSRILTTGLEKVALNSVLFEKPELVTKIAERFGSQSLIASIDVKKNFFGKYEVYSHSGKQVATKDPLEWAKKLQELGAGEVLLTSVDREGTWEGLDSELINSVASKLSIPVIAHGGANSVPDIANAVKFGKASAVALGSSVVYQKKGMGVLVNFPDIHKLEAALA
ncbi:AglZ/HisF2 family acetamidino modification protein [soil metagenome]